MPVMSVALAAAPPELSARCRAITRQPALVELKLCLLAAVFVSLGGPRHCGFPGQGAYAREALEMSAPAFSRRRRVGLFLLHSRAARDGLLSGAFSFSALELLLRRVGGEAAQERLDLLPGRSLTELEAALDALEAGGGGNEDGNGDDNEDDNGDDNDADNGDDNDADNGDDNDADNGDDNEDDNGDDNGGDNDADNSAEPPAPPAPAHDETTVVLRLHPPEPLARLIVDNQELARQLSGEPDEASANAMWIAEAAAESEANPPDGNPWRQLGLRTPKSRTRAPQPPAPRVDLPLPRRIRGHRDKLEHIDRRLVALAEQYRLARSTMRDQLYQLYQDKVWFELGYNSAEAFADKELGLAPRAWWQAIEDARLRARKDPIATALARGEIGDWAARRLDGFRRSAHIGASGLPAWIAAARELSSVALSERIDHARQQARFEARDYALRGWPVPTDEDLRTPERSLERLVEAPDLPTEQALLASRHVELELELSPTARDELLAMWTTLHRQRKREHPDTSPWTSLLILAARARLGLLQLALANDEPARAAIHWRDGWRCANPACGARKCLHSHHIHPLGQGGPDTPENQITLCEYCHIHLLHQGLLRITGEAGDPDKPLCFEMSFDANGRPRRVYEGGRKVKVVA